MKKLAIYSLCFILPLTLFSSEFPEIGALIDSDSRDALLFDVSAGTSSFLWVSCRLAVFEEIRSQRRGAVLRHLVERRKSSVKNINRIEKLIMLTLTSSSTGLKYSIKDDKVSWRIPQSSVKSVYSSFPSDENWSIWLDEESAKIAK